MTHNCKDCLCDTPHEEPTDEEMAAEYAREKKKYLSWDKLMKKILCPHGFRRSTMPDFDCHQCREKEKSNVTSKAV